VQEWSIAAHSRPRAATPFGARVMGMRIVRARTPQGTAPAAPVVCRGAAPRRARRHHLVEMGESRTPRPEPSAEDQLRACPMVCRQPIRLPSAASRPVQSRPLSGFASDYATLLGGASPLNDASTAHGDEAASTLTLPPKRRGREQAGGCQLLRFAACLTRPDGTSARVLRSAGPVETTHPQVPIVAHGTPVLN